MVKKIFLSLVLLSFSFALGVNDEIGKEILNKIRVTKKIVVIDFFASWCVSCEKELPLIDKLSKSMNDVQFLGIDSDEKKEEGLAFQKRLKLSFSIFNDNDQKIIKAFDPVGVPAVYIIQNGLIKKSHFGALNNIDEVIKKDILELK